ncbi:MAG: cupin domain-containing protein [Rhodospirillales bacterium]|nr:cupin domain-containing protein [Rhodospirillales bacterium]MCC7166416.1 cupin domain-containing protein [Rhodospirillales bacterium]
MADLTRTRSREQEAPPALKYDMAYQKRGDFIEHGETSKVLVRDTDREWELCRQGHIKWYILEHEYPETALNDWWVFVHDIKKVSGKHRHQGGLVLFIIEGHGATEVNGELIEWEKGDCVLLPMDPNGIEHKHYNYGTEPAKWLAFIHIPTWDHVASELVQIEISQDFQQKMAK